MIKTSTQPAFKLGRLVCTPGAIDLLLSLGFPAEEFLSRHVRMDGGDLSEEDQKANEDGLRDGERIFSSYKIGSKDRKLWVITEWDRSVTTLLLPEDY